MAELQSRDDAGADHDAIAVWLAQQVAAAAPEEIYQYPTDPSDPADYSSGFEQTGSALLGDLGALAPTSFGYAVNDQAVTDALGGLMQGHSPDANTGAKGTGLGLAVTGYASDLGSIAESHNAVADAITASIVDAMATSTAINNAVDAMGYNSSPAPAPSFSPDPGFTSIEAGLSNPGGLITSNASLDTGPGVGIDAGAAIAADVAGLTGLNAGVNDAVAGYTSDPGGFGAPGDPGSGLGGPGDSGPGGGITGGDAGVSGGFSGGVDAGGGISW